MDKPAARSRRATRAPAGPETEPAALAKRPRGRPRKTADERNDGHARFVEADRVCQALNRERREGVERGVSHLVRAAGRHQHVLGIVEFGQQAVERVPSHKVSGQ